MIGILLYALALAFAWPMLLIGGWLGVALEVLWLAVLYWRLAVILGKFNGSLGDTGNAALPWIPNTVDNLWLLKRVPKFTVWLLLILLAGWVFIFGSFGGDDGSAGTVPLSAPAASTNVTDPTTPAPQPLPPSVSTAAAMSADIPLCAAGEIDCYRYFVNDENWAKPGTCAGTGCQSPWWRDK